MNEKLKTLRKLINKHFSLRDLKDVAFFEFGIEPDSLRHSTKPEFTLDLISYLGHAERLTELVDYLKELRQSVTWPDITAADFNPTYFEPAPPVVTHIHGDVHTGDKINMSGDFRGAMVNVKSTLTDVQQSIGRAPHGEDSEKVALTRLITELTNMLDTLPATHTDQLANQVEAVAHIANALADLANDQKSQSHIAAVER